MICKVCNKIKNDEEFYENHKQCKDCWKAKVRNNPKMKSNSTESYDKTEKGVIRVLYKTQKSNSKRRKHPAPAYSKEELREWMYASGYEDIYKEWKESGYERHKKPSVDRRDDFKPYTLDNIRMTTWGANKQKQTDDILAGVGTSGARCKPVECYKDGVLIKRYVSYSAAVRDVGYHFEKTLKSGNPDRRNRYVWKYVNKEIE